MQATPRTGKPGSPEAALLLVSSNNRDLDLWESPTLVQHLKFTDFQSLRARSESEKSDWLRIRNDYSAHVQIIGPSQRSRLLVLTLRSVVSGDENVQRFTNIALLLLSPTIAFSPFERVSLVFHRTQNYNRQDHSSTNIKIQSCTCAVFTCGRKMT